MARPYVSVRRAGSTGKRSLIRRTCARSDGTFHLIVDRNYSEAVLTPVSHFCSRLSILVPMHRFSSQVCWRERSALHV